MFWLTALCCKEAIPFSLYGEIKNISTNPNGWAYFSTTFGDFGHNVRIRAWNNKSEITKFYTSLDHTCPNTESQTNEGEVSLAGGTSQYRVWGVFTNNTNASLTVSVASKVRPIHPHTPALVIHGIFIFFGLNFVVTGFLQFYYFKTSMDPNEYLQPIDF
jgi:hypothetical protein